jgi:Tol biopolymer transport system component
VNADGSGERPIHPPTGGLFPDWSPDGSKIAFSGVLHPGDGDDYVFVMRPDGTHPTALHVDHTGECEEWSPDGSKLMFCSHWAGPFDVGVMHADGSHLRRLTDAPGNDYPGAWSPDGERIAFSSLRDGNGEVYVMDADGSNQTRLTHSPATYDAPDAWLPDGRIVVASSKENAPLPDWFVMDPDGTHIRSLPQLRGAEPDRLAATPHDPGLLTWSCAAASTLPPCKRGRAVSPSRCWRRCEWWPGRRA